MFPSHLPRQALWSASLALRRLGANATTHGMRASFRMWAADQGVPFEVAEQCLAHTLFLSGEADAKVVVMSGRRKRS